MSVRGLAGILVFVAALLVPTLGSRFYTFLANDVIIWALFATSLNLLVGYTGLVSFGHAAYFGVGAYVTGILMKKLAVPFLLAWPAAGVVGAACALVFGFFCVRLTRIYFAMLTLAFAQIVWAICFKWNELTGGEQGMPEIPYPDFGWLERFGASVPLLGGWRTAEYFYFLCVGLVGASLWALHRIVTSPFGRMLTTIRENAERAEFSGVPVRRTIYIAFVTAGFFAGLSGALLAPLEQTVSPSTAHWTKSAEPVMATLIGGPLSFLGPIVGAVVYLGLKEIIVRFTEYWLLVFGLVLLATVLTFRGGLMGALTAWLLRRQRP